jgi:hypothetical protein
LQQIASNLLQQIETRDVNTMQDYLEELLDQPLVVDGQSADFEADIDDYLDDYAEV